MTKSWLDEMLTVADTYKGRTINDEMKANFKSDMELATPGRCLILPADHQVGQFRASVEFRGASYVVELTGGRAV